MTHPELPTGGKYSSAGDETLLNSSLLRMRDEVQACFGDCSQIDRFDAALSRQAEEALQT